MPTATNGCTSLVRTSSRTNTRTHLATLQRVEDWQYDFTPLSPGALPTTVFSNNHSLKLNNTALDLQYYGPAHTDSDISGHLADLDILHTGDTFWNGIYPFIDYSTGRSIDGQIRTAKPTAAFDSKWGQFVIGPALFTKLVYEGV
jgi:glyoxylase-like metal-dependent hydrolase (beta-lactamase superfamily II)